MGLAEALATLRRVNDETYELDLGSHTYLIQWKLYYRLSGADVAGWEWRCTSHFTRAYNVYPTVEETLKRLLRAHARLVRGGRSRSTSKP